MRTATRYLLLLGIVALTVPRGAAAQDGAVMPQDVVATPPPPPIVTPTPAVMAAATTAHETVCTGNQDEDGDGLADCADADCFSARECRAGGSEERSNDACSDWIDNDGDSAVDCDDDECSLDWITVCRGSYSSGGGGSGATAGSETGADSELPELGEGMSVEDLIGTGGDTDGERTDEACADGIDNDMDGRADCRDFGCRFDPQVNVCQGSPGIRFSVVAGAGAALTLNYDADGTYLGNTPEAGFTLLQLRALGSIPFINNSFFLINIRAESSVRLTFLMFQVPLGDAGHFFGINSGSGTLSVARIISASRHPLLEPAFYMLNAFEQGNGFQLEAGGPIDSGGILRFRIFAAAGTGLFSGSVGGARIDTTPEAGNFSYAVGARFQVDAVGHYDPLDPGMIYTPLPLTLAFIAGAKWDQRTTEQAAVWYGMAVFRWWHFHLRGEVIGRYVMDFGQGAQQAWNLQLSALLVPRLLMLAADVGSFNRLLEYDPTMVPTTMRASIILPEELQWRVALHWYFFRNVGVLSGVYRENYSPEVESTSSLRPAVERELRLEARFRF